VITKSEAPLLVYEIRWDTHNCLLEQKNRNLTLKKPLSFAPPEGCCGLSQHGGSSFCGSRQIDQGSGIRHVP